MVRIQCPKCRSGKIYLLGTGKRRCARCHYDFTTHRLPLYLTKDQWKEIISWFLLEQSSQTILFGPQLSGEECSTLSQSSGTSLSKIFRISSLVLSRLMRPVSEGSGGINERLSEIREPNEGEEQKSNQSSGSSVVTGLSGQKLWMTWKQLHSNP